MSLAFFTVKVIVAILVVILSFECVQGSAIEKAIDESGGKTDLSSIYKVALSWYNTQEEKSKLEAVEVFHQLADTGDHVMSAVKLGHHYVENGDRPLAIKYFVLAGEKGPHHQSLYNAGKLSAEQGDWVEAMAYLKTAATLSQSYATKFISNETTKSALEAYEIVSRRLSREKLSIMQSANIFLSASLNDLPKKAEELWVKAVQALMDIDEAPSNEDIRNVMNPLETLWETYGVPELLSHLQILLQMMLFLDP